MRITIDEFFAKFGIGIHLNTDKTTRKLCFFNFPDEVPADKAARIPPAETFAFSLNTLLNDVATHNPHLADRIFEAHLQLMSGILAQLQEMKKHEAPSPFNTRKATCKCMVPVLLGLSRALGRFSPPAEDFLLNKIYPRSPPGCSGHGSLGPGQGEPDQNDKIKGYSNFRSIIPRSLSSTFQTGSPLISSMSSDSVVDLSFRPNLRTDLMCHQSEKQKNKEREKKIAFQSQTSVQPYDPTTYFFHKIGSSFNQLQAPLTKTINSSRTDKTGLLAFKESMIRNIFQVFFWLKKRH